MTLSYYNTPVCCGTVVENTVLDTECCYKNIKNQKYQIIINY